MIFMLMLSNMNRVQAIVLEFNVASLKMHQKSGCRIDGPFASISV